MNEDFSEMEFSVLKGKILTEINGSVKGTILVFKTDDGEEYHLYHNEICCEEVILEDVEGDFKDLIGTPILLAEIATNIPSPTTRPKLISLPQEEFTWSFYRIATSKGFVVLRWYGESNGHYSETAYFAKINR